MHSNPRQSKGVQIASPRKSHPNEQNGSLGRLRRARGGASGMAQGRSAYAEGSYAGYKTPFRRKDVGGR